MLNYMKKVLSIIIACVIMLFTFAACSSGSNYLSWKSEDYNKASDADKLKCVESFINATLKSRGADELSGDELTDSAKAIQEILENGIDTYPDKTIQDIIDMGASSSSAAE